MERSPSFAEVVESEEISLNARLRATRAAIQHAGEKGRALESVVATLLRDLLPNEYGISTGFVVYVGEDDSVALSSQLDIIIYDALSSGPLVRLGPIDVVPLEAVFGYV